MPITDIIECEYLSQGYGCTSFAGEWVDPSCPGGHKHTGIDLPCAMRVPIKSPRDGVVVAIGIIYLGPQAVCIKLDDGIFLEFGHCDQALVQVGQSVKAGQVVALAGTKGNSTGPHLHLEARVDGPYQSVDNNIDPSIYLWVQKPIIIIPDKPKPLEELMQPVTVQPGETGFYPVAADTDTFTTDWNVLATSDSVVQVIAYDPASGAVIGATGDLALAGNLADQHGPKQQFGGMSDVGCTGRSATLGFRNKGKAPIQYTVHREYK